MSTVSTIAINLGYLYRRPLPYLNYSSCGKSSISNCVVLLVSDF